jgi:hypothetical protein
VVAPTGATEKEERAIKAENSKRWVKAVGRIASVAAKAPQHKGLVREHVLLPMISPGHLFSTLKSVLVDVFQIDRADEYFMNVQRFQRLVADMVVGLRGLTTEARLQWWSTHQVPADIPYYGLTGSMADRTFEGEPVPLVNSPYYGQKTADYLNLRTSFYTMSDYTGVELNDSQVAVPKACFWPGLSSKLNPQQPPIETRFLGVLGTHHWGLALPISMESIDDQINPFPRTVLLEAMAACVLE